MPLIGKFSTARCVEAPYRASSGTFISPMESRSIRKLMKKILESAPNARRRIDPSPANGKGAAPVILDHLFRARTLYALSALFILYGTTMPWDIAPPPDWEGVQWRPFWDASRERFPSVPDMVQNVMFFIPFGVFGFLARRRVFEVIATGAALSCFVEFLQTMSETRTASTSDLLMNSAGTFTGVMAALWVDANFGGGALRYARKQPGAVVVFALFGAIVWLALAPFLPTLDVGAFKGQVKLFFASPWGRKSLLQLLFSVVLYAGFTVVLAREIPAIRNRHVPHTVGVAYALVIACMLEFLQFFFLGHHPAVQDIAAGWAGTAVGAAVALKVGLQHARRPGELSRTAPRWAFAFALLLPGLRALDPFAFTSEPAAVTAWNFVPFASLFGQVNAFTIANFFTVVAVYVPLAHVLWARGRPVWAMALATMACAATLEAAQLFVPGRTFDMTEALVAGASALVVAGFWRQTSMR